MITVFEDRQPTLEEAQKIVGGLWRWYILHQEDWQSKRRRTA